MLPETETAATIDDLYRAEGKAELIGGRIVELLPTGRRSNIVAGSVYIELIGYVRATGRGEAYTDNIGFTVPELSSGRQSFSPDASYYFGPFLDDDRRFVRGAPTFAVEVRSENAYGPAAEDDIAAQRVDYFEAGTKIVWDVDPEAETVAVYRIDAPATPVVYRRGQQAEAEPAVPGWRMAVDRVFERPGQIT
jgi:Uma2 family endonuclease